MSIQFMITSSEQLTKQSLTSNIEVKTTPEQIPASANLVGQTLAGQPVASENHAESELLDSEYSLASPFPEVPKPVEPRSFEEAVERYHGKVFQLVYRYLGDYEEACDITQDTFVRAYSAWGEFRGESQIYTWLYRIAINLCHNQQKKLQRRRRVERVSLDAPIDEESSGGRDVADERPLPLQVLESQELRVRLQQVLQELPENYRTVVILRDIEGLSYEEIARITDSTLEAIKSRLFRARGAIRRMMEPYLSAEAQKATAPVEATIPQKSASRRADKEGSKPRRPRFRLL